MKKEIPNCNLCEWYGLGNCRAQGFENTQICYNSSLCKKLYKSKIKTNKFNEFLLNKILDIKYNHNKFNLFCDPSALASTVFY